MGQKTYRISIDLLGEVIENKVVDKYIEHDEDILTLERIKKREDEDKK